MARKQEIVVIEDEGRDKGKTFVITEMSSDRGERWAIRALLALTNAGVTVDDHSMSAGMAGIAAVGLEALGRLSFEAAEPLLEEMFSCIKIKPSAKAPEREIMQGDDGDIEEIKTRLTLRMAVLKLHVNFSEAVEAPTTASPKSAKAIGI